MLRENIFTYIGIDIGQLGSVIRGDKHSTGTFCKFLQWGFRTRFKRNGIYGCILSFGFVRYNRYIRYPGIIFTIRKDDDCSRIRFVYDFFEAIKSAIEDISAISSFLSEVIFWCTNVESSYPRNPTMAVLS